jgi:transmembrane sensor
VVATGTLFDVSLIGGRTAVIILEGSVEVRQKDSRRPIEQLKTGQRLILSDSAPAKRELGMGGDEAWPARMLKFDNTKLDEAVALANRYGSAQLKVSDKQTGNLRVSGAFRAGDAAGFARSLAAAFDLRVVPQPDGSLLLVGANPSDRASAR